MRGVTPEAKVRNVSKQLGCEITIDRNLDGSPFSFSVVDRELDGRAFFALIMRPSEFERTLSGIHEAVYRARGEAKYKEQKGLCCFCELPLNGVYEVDHKIPRARGRDDRMENLQVCHTGFVCDGHRRKHGG